MKRFRKTITLLLLYSLVITSISGVIVYIGPIDRVASNLQWSMLWLTKSQWDDIHTLFGFVLILAGIAHLVLNGRTMFSYVRGKLSLSISHHFITATLITGLLMVATLYQWLPINTILDFGEQQRRSWAREMMLQRIEQLPPHMRESARQQLRQGGMR